MNLWYKRGISFLLILCMVFGMVSVSAFAETTENSPFTDVSPRAWYRHAIAYVYRHNVMLGVRPDTFAPYVELSRAMMAATLFRLEHGRAAEPGDVRESPFHDVLRDSWFAPYISWAYDQGIVEGVGNGRFAPHNTLTREQFAVMLHRYAAPDYIVRVSMLYPDAGQWSGWAEDAMHWAVSRSILRGTGAGMLNPRGSVSRADCAVMLMRFMTVDIQALLWRDFDDVSHLLGNLIDSGSLYGGMEWRSFDTGLLVFVTEPETRGGTFLSVHVDYTDEHDRSLFRFWDIDGTSTIADVELMFEGREPDFVEMWDDYGDYSEIIFSYTYVFSEENDHFVRFTFDLDGTVMAITHAVTTLPPPPGETLDIYEIMWRGFDLISHLLGNEIGREAINPSLEYRFFDSDLTIVVEAGLFDGTVVFVHVDYWRAADRSQFHLWGIDGTFTSDEVKALFESWGEEPSSTHMWETYPEQIFYLKYDRPKEIPATLRFSFDVFGIVTAITFTYPAAFANPFPPPVPGEPYEIGEVRLVSGDAEHLPHIQPLLAAYFFDGRFVTTRGEPFSSAVLRCPEAQEALRAMPIIPHANDLCIVIDSEDRKFLNYRINFQVYLVEDGALELISASGTMLDVGRLPVVLPQQRGVYLFCVDILWNSGGHEFTHLQYVFKIER